MDSALVAIRRKRFTKLHKELRKLFPDAVLALRHKTHWQLLVAVQLSAQSTDKKVNEILPGLFKKYPTIQAFADAKGKELEKAVSSVLYYRNKAKNIQAAAKKVLNEYGGRLPKTMDAMLTLPGVARKTANVLLGTLFGVVEGVVVDTHVVRFARRFDLTDYKDPVRIEKDLMEIIPRAHWYTVTYKIIEYGRGYGNPRGKRPLREGDPLIKQYPQAREYWP